MLIKKFELKNLIYSQIWLNLPSDDGHWFFYIFLWMIATQATLKKSLKKTLELVLLCKGLVFTCIHFFGWNEHTRLSNLQLEQVGQKIQAEDRVESQGGKGWGTSE